MRIILASASPRRLEILNKHGYEPVVMPADVDETINGKPDMTAAVRDLSLRKARACYDMISSEPKLQKKYADHLIIAADTIVYKDEILGKPSDEEDAFRMLSLYRGTYHYVATGITLIKTNDGSEKIMHDVTRVWCRDYSDRDIREYISSEKPYDKAGSYAIQGDFSMYIDHIDGDYENVIGLPFYLIEDELKNYKDN